MSSSDKWRREGADRLKRVRGLVAEANKLYDEGQKEVAHMWAMAYGDRQAIIDKVPGFDMFEFESAEIRDADARADRVVQKLNNAAVPEIGGDQWVNEGLVKSLAGTVTVQTDGLRAMRKSFEEFRRAWGITPTGSAPSPALITGELVV